MAKKKRSALKRIRQTVRRTTIKAAGRSSARSAVKAARTAIAMGGDEMMSAVSAVLHRNSAARRRSRLAKQAARASKS
jgi:ribosomal protein S20